MKMRCLLLLPLLYGLLIADGMMVGPELEVMEAGQVAIIKYQEGREELSLATRFSTEASSVAWLVPLPAAPEVDSAPADRFSRFAEYCAPLRRSNHGLGCGCMSEAPGPGGYGDSSGVREIGYGIIGDLTWQIIRAFASDTLENYLVGHGYHLPNGTRIAFDHYLDQGWNYFFVAQSSDTSEQYYQDRSVGIKLSFASDSIVYPLYISRVSSASSNIVFYLLAEHRQMFRGAQLRFSGKAGPADFPGFLDREYHLTKLTKVFAPEQMEDIRFSNAPDDQEYREIEYTTDYGVIPLGIVFAGFLAFWPRRRKRTQ